MILSRFPLHAQSVASKEGLTRGIALLPITAQVLCLIAVPPKGEISLFALVPERPLDSDGQPKPYQPHETAAMEFVVATEGATVGSDYVFRGPVKTLDGAGILFLFESRKSAPRIVVPGQA